MKKLLFLLMLAFAVNSCSVDDGVSGEYVILTVDSVVMPDSFAVNQVSTITVKYRRPTDCHIFDGFYYNAQDSTRVVAIQTIKLNQNDCAADSDSLFEVPLNFKPLTPGNYVFKFWTGDVNGVSEFEEHDVVVE